MCSNLTSVSTRSSSSSSSSSEYSSTSGSISSLLSTPLPSMHSLLPQPPSPSLLSMLRNHFKVHKTESLTGKKWSDLQAEARTNKVFKYVIAKYVIAVVQWHGEIIPFDAIELLNQMTDSTPEELCLKVSKFKKRPPILLKINPLTRLFFYSIDLKIPFKAKNFKSFFGENQINSYPIKIGDTTESLASIAILACNPHNEEEDRTNARFIVANILNRLSKSSPGMEYAREESFFWAPWLPKISPEQKT